MGGELHSSKEESDHELKKKNEMLCLWPKDLVLSEPNKNNARRSGSLLLTLEGEVFKGSDLEA